MNIELLPFQRNAIRELQQAVENGKPGITTEITLESCTGSGKTIILTHFMDEYLHCNGKTVFVWFTPGKGNLEEQSKKKMDAYIHGRTTKLLSDIMTSGFAENDCCFINWELLNKKGNNALKDGEHTNFKEYVDKSLDAGLDFKLIIDESHTNDTIKTKAIIDFFHPSTIIKASATPKGNSTNRVVVLEEDVIAQGLIKKLLVINENFNKLAGATIDDNQVDFLLSKALEKQQLLRSKFLQNGTDINPLILVQMPNTSDTLLEQVTTWFEQHKISFENNLLAIWMNERKSSKGTTMHENLDGIEKNNAEPVAMIFKLAVATGWDCPRAHILVKLRDNMGETFEIQTIGRIRRMPEAKHYGDDDLDNCYLYTLDEKFIEGAKKNLGKDALDASLLHLKDEYKTFELPGERHPDENDEHDPKQAKAALIGHFKQKYNLDGKNNQLKFESKGYKFSQYIENETLTGTIHTLPQISDLQTVDFKTPLNTHVHGRVYHHFIGQISSDIGLSYENVNTIMRQLFCELPKKTGQTKLLRLDRRSIYSFVINNIDKLREDFKQAASDQLKAGTLGISTRRKESFIFKIPETCLFTYNASAMFQDVYSKNVYEKYLASAEIRSAPEQAFENFCQSSDAVIWFYKNGDKGSDYYSIVYEDNNGKQRNFFPDYVVKTKEGLWIIETKGGQTKAGQSQDIDPFSPKKFEALKAYIQVMQKDGRAIFGGFVRQNGIHLCICTDTYSDKIASPNWQLLDDVLK